MHEISSFELIMFSFLAGVVMRMLIEKINQNKKNEKLYKMLIRCHNKQKQMEESGETNSKKYRDIVENAKKLEIYFYGVGIDFMIYDC